MNEEPLLLNISNLLTALGRHIPDEETRGRLSVDLQDLVETSRRLLATLGAVDDRAYTDEELETLLTELEVAHLDHASYHIASLRTALTAVLATFPDDDPD